MSRRRRNRRHSQEEVQLSLTAMLDMAFQLLAFFILTFKPSPIEGQLSLMLPPPQPMTSVDPQTSENATGNGVAALKTLTITVQSDPTGQVAQVKVGVGTAFNGPADAPNLYTLSRQLRDILGLQGTPYEQVVVRVAPALHYEELMKIIDVCTRQKMPDGQLLQKISFVELGEEKK